MNQVSADASLDMSGSKVEINTRALQNVDASFDVLCKDFVFSIAIYATDFIERSFTGTSSKFEHSSS